MIRAKGKIFLIPALAGAFVLLAAATVPAGVRLVFKAEVTCDEAQIKVGHLLAGISGASAELAKQIREVVVAEAPAPGQVKTLSASEINARLTYGRIKQERFQAEIPAQVKIFRPARRMTRTELVALFQEKVLAGLTWRPEEVIVEDVRTPEEILLPQGHLEVVAEPPKPQDLPGRVTLRLSFKSQGRVVERIALNGLVQFKIRRVVAARPLPAGHILEEADLAVENRIVSRENSRAVESPEAAAGFKLKRSLQAGQIVETDQLQKPTLVKRGDKVIMVARQGRLRITASGIVQTARAAQGDQVVVRNLSTRREVHGRLVSRELVEVIF